jgi:Flp pilus assembly protein TadD
MIIAYLMASVAAPPAGDVAFDHMVAGRHETAVAILEARPAGLKDPALLINLGIAYARQGDSARARTLFEAALRSPDRVELETATGAWVDSRILARQALTMLDAGKFATPGQLARK